MSAENAITLRVSGMTCASCVRRVERALAKVEGVEAASVNFASETARVTLGERGGAGALVAAVERAGYGAALAEAGQETPLRNERATIVRLAVGAGLGVPVIILAMAMDIADLPLLGSARATGWLLLAAAGVVQIVLGVALLPRFAPRPPRAHAKHGRARRAGDHGRLRVQRLGRALRPGRGDVLRRECRRAPLREYGQVLRGPRQARRGERHSLPAGARSQVGEPPSQW